MICGQTCDGLYHFAFYLVNFGIPLDPSQSSQPWPDTQVSRCLWFPPKGSRDHFRPITGARCVSPWPIKIGTFHILPTGLHGLCFGFCFAAPLPLRSLLHGPLSRVHFGESLVVRLYSEIDHMHLSSEAQCVSHHLPQVDCHNHFEYFSKRCHAKHGLFNVE